jgi:Peptidase S46
LKARSSDLAKSNDPFVKAAVALIPLVLEQEKKNEIRSGELAMVAPSYATALRESLGGMLAPDANSTLRITYGTVKGRVLDGKMQAPFTLASELLSKDTGKDPFDSPKPLLAAVKAKQFGPYASAALGDLPVNFLSDVDTTGGNSGSPTLNAEGELVGLLFDGTIESVASDVVFNSQITRSIHCDIRYALWVMDRLDGAQALLKEMGVAPAAF